MLRRREGEREGEPIGLRGHVVVEHGCARQPPSAQPRVPLSRVAARHDAAARQAMRRGHAPVAPGPDDAIEREAGAHRCLAAHQGSVNRHGERQRPHRLRRDPRQRPPLAHRFARPAKVERLQVAEPTVNGAEVIERGAAAEIVLLDERHRQTPLRGVIRNRQAVNAATDHEHIEGVAGQRIEIADHPGHRIAIGCLRELRL